ncbi:LysR substrate-binding domain-containing protein [Aeromonas veronii]|uniref:LysR substrate-binding domain-containing protein n=1 Tax=Aeromonas veronii TaxID=654 RepID=UPI00193263E7|nr:LysR substrate-binding domain-containing protein [Aeromonas veronii]MBM0418585.1 LysR family transcriptional regulator [Aeromonas veronii]MBW3790568.1 LysR family transcriptional regulator [Aeromonas veronii]
MSPLPQSLDLDALRSYVLGLECGSFALAAQRLCRSTSAVSAQLKKLEQQCGTELVMKKGRHLVPTASGERLLGYAKRLLDLNDEAVLALKGGLLQGEIRLGVQEDFGESLLPAVLGPFCRQHPALSMTTRIDRNASLMKGIREGTLDIVLAWQSTEEKLDTALIDIAALQWIAHPNWELVPLLACGEPLPLVLFDAPCLMRSRAIKALDDAGIPWRIAFTSQSLGGIWAAVQAGLGITVRSTIGMPASLATLGGVLPSPGTLGVVLLGASHEAGEAERLLQRLLTNAVHQA